MPFAQQHYPFSITEEEFSKRFPGDFIAEGLDQTRGWFYTLNVISTALKNSEPYKNLIVNGLILAEDGQKMSKSKQNFPDPMKMVEQFSADAVKLYMLNSPVVRAEPLKFSVDGVKGVVKSVFLPWYNSYRFLIQNIYRMEESTSSKFIFDPKYKYQTDNILDKWIIGAKQNLIKAFRNEMDNYRLDTIIRYLLSFLDDLTRWYIRLNRNRMKGLEGTHEMQTSLNILFDVLFSTTLMMSCFTPFISEYMYLNLRNGFEQTDQNYKESIHFLQIPKFHTDLVNDEIVNSVYHMKKIVELVRQARDIEGIPIKRPINRVTIVNSDSEISKSVEMLYDYIISEVNCIHLDEHNDEDKFVTYNIDFNHKSLGQRLKNRYNKQLRDKISSFDSTQIKQFQDQGKTMVDDIEIFQEDLILNKVFRPEVSNTKQTATITDDQYAIIIDYSSNEEIEKKYLLRQFVTSVQKFRKELELNIDDDIQIFYKADTEMMSSVLKSEEEYIQNTLLRPFG